MDNHIDDLIEEYVLGNLGEVETARIRKHLASCVPCQEEVQWTEMTLAHLPHIVPEASPPEVLRARLLESLSSLTSVSKPASIKAPASKRPSLWQSFSGWRVPALAGLVIFLLVVTNILLWRQNNLLRAEIEQTDMLVLPLHPSQETSLATGILVMDPRGQFGTIVVDSLAPTAEGQQYQVWLSKDGQTFSGGELVVHNSGYGAQIIYMPEPLYLYTQVWLTIEPQGLSETPTGVTVLQTR